MTARLYLTNREGLADWTIRDGFWRDRPHGLSAMVRLKDEAEWLKPSLDSIAGWCDEVALFLQGAQTDGTDRVAEEWAAAHPDIAKVYRFPFDSLPNGPGHDRQPRGSVHERAYFYNWCLALTRFDHAMKWDGDMVALDDLGPKVRGLMAEGRADLVGFRGIEMCGTALTHMSRAPRTANEPRVFRVNEGTWYHTGARTEYFTLQSGWRERPEAVEIAPAPYLHFKWAKDEASATKAWPPDWQSEPNGHYRRLMERKAKPGERYDGPWPSALSSRNVGR